MRHRPLCVPWRLGHEEPFGQPPDPNKPGNGLTLPQQKIGAQSSKFQRLGLAVHALLISLHARRRRIEWRHWPTRSCISRVVFRWRGFLMSLGLCGLQMMKFAGKLQKRFMGEFHRPFRSIMERLPWRCIMRSWGFVGRSPSGHFSGHHTFISELEKLNWRVLEGRKKELVATSLPAWRDTLRA
ncbi:hypothetical protein DM02DRAFT_685496, partial [Periconia macrospinosa]